MPATPAGGRHSEKYNYFNFDDCMELDFEFSEENVVLGDRSIMFDPFAKGGDDNYCPTVPDDDTSEELRDVQLWGLIPSEEWENVVGTCPTGYTRCSNNAKDGQILGLDDCTHHAENPFFCELYFPTCV